MSGLNTDLSGQWDGHFEYPAGCGPMTVFLATIRQSGGQIDGTIIEPDLYSAATPAEATFHGMVSGGAVEFTKVYHRASMGYRHPVDYVGQILDDGTRIAGVWTVLDLDGTFEMIRHAAKADAAQRETAAETSR